MEVKTFYADEINEVIPELARLRITVFHDFPYLYEGDYEYEKKYLKIYTDSKQSALVVAFDQNKIIGAASAIPLKDEADYVQKPFLENQLPIDQIYYFGESVLLKEYRGLGLGHAFFDGREAAAKKFAYQYAYFCGVQRINHPKQPEGYRPLDEFWKKRGYQKVDHLQSDFSWKDIGDDHETLKKMTYWMRELK